MQAIRVIGGKKLHGTIDISGAKNAALPILCSTLLTDQALSFDRVPDLVDIETLCALLRQHGTQINRLSGGLRLITPEIKSATAPYELVSKMRASILVLGPLLARHGQAKVALPGGCAIGSRPVDLHSHAMKTLGAQVDIQNGNVVAKTPSKGLIGGVVRFSKASVGATENALMAASLAKGTTRLENAAKEPEIIDLGLLLQTMGAPIEGLGTSTIEIEGQTSLKGCHHQVVPDRIVAGTFAIATLMTGGNIFLRGARGEHLETHLELLCQAGAICEVQDAGIQVRANGSRPRAFDAITKEYPGFPTDLQAQLMALACIADSKSTITETIFENRFMHVDELIRLGADIQVSGNQAVISGQRQLSGAQVNATDLRAAAALILAGLAAEGDTYVTALEHLDRGYEKFEEKLRGVGADLERISL